MTQFLRDQASDNEEVVTPIMLDGTYLSKNFASWVYQLMIQFIVVSSFFLQDYISFIFREQAKSLGINLRSLCLGAASFVQLPYPRRAFIQELTDDKGEGERR